LARKSSLTVAIILILLVSLFLFFPITSYSQGQRSPSPLIQHSYSVGSCWGCAFKSIVSFSKNVAKGDLIVAITGTDFNLNMVMSDSMGNNYTNYYSHGVGGIMQWIFFTYAKQSGPLNITFSYAQAPLQTVMFASFGYELQHNYVPATTEKSLGYATIRYHPNGKCCKVSWFSISEPSFVIGSVYDNTAWNATSRTWTAGKHGWTLAFPSSTNSTGASEYKLATGNETRAQMKSSNGPPWIELAVGFVPK
jgi:hypothetical protein